MAQPLKSPRLPQLVAAGLALVGVVLIVSSFLVRPQGIAAQVWSRADAESYAHAGLEAKRLVHEKSHGKAIEESQVKQALADYQSRRTRLEQAQRYGLRLVAILRWSGVGATAVAALVYGWFHQTA